jgi:hypothetical protein
MSFNPIHVLADPSNPNSLSKRFRRARMRHVVGLIERIHAEKGRVRIADLGGRPEYWEMFDRDMLQACCVHVTLIGLEAGEGDDPLFTHVVGDACALPEHGDDSFDLAHSNSVIEHVGDWPRMEAFAGEMRRIAPRYYVQTPYFWFPIEPHFSAAFFHWRSEQSRAKRLLKGPLGFSQQARHMGEAMRDVQDARLLDKAQFRFLFPDAAYVDEKIAGLTKSLIALRDRPTLN